MTYWKVQWRNDYGYLKVEYFENLKDADDWFHFLASFNLTIDPPEPVTVFDLIQE